MIQIYLRAKSTKNHLSWESEFRWFRESKLTWGLVLQNKTLTNMSHSAPTPPLPKIQIQTTVVPSVIEWNQTKAWLHYVDGLVLVELTSKSPMFSKAKCKVLQEPVPAFLSLVLGGVISWNTWMPSPQALPRTDDLGELDTWHRPRAQHHLCRGENDFSVQRWRQTYHSTPWANFWSHLSKLLMEDFSFSGMTVFFFIVT